MTSDEKAILTLEVGPVEDFVAESRRTRDLWAASYILSYLMAHALCAAEDAGAVIRQPALDTNQLYHAVRLRRAQQPIPKDDVRTARQVGSLPDLFEAEVPAPKARDIAEATIVAWWSAWRQLADAVWDHLKQKGWPADDQTRTLWDRQIGRVGRRDVWDIRWTVRPTGGPTDEHGRRWNFYPFDGLGDAGAGDRSTLSPNRVALRAGSGEPAQARRFWAAVSQRVGPYNIRPGGAERLDAVSVVKRFLPLVAEAALGWKVQTSYPSTRSVAVAPWLGKVLETTNDDLQLLVSDAATALAKTGLERANPVVLPALSQAAERHEFADACRQLLQYDGDIFYPDSEDGWEGLPEKEAAEARTQVRCLRTTAGRLGIEPPSDFFAILAMDGDRLTQALSSAPEMVSEMSRALTRFAGEVPKVVECYLGQLVYAGGDDVLALLPIETALEAAAALRKHWREVMRDQWAGTDAAAAIPTISAGIIFAHVATPLGVVVRRSHDLLDQVAKDQVGRNAFAVEVWSPGGRLAAIGCPWDGPAAAGDDGSARSTIDEIRWAAGEVRRARRADANNDQPRRSGFSSHFMYKLYDLIEMANAQTWGAFEREQQIEVFLAEHLANRDIAYQTASDRPGTDSDAERERLLVAERERVARLRDLLQRRSNQETRADGAARSPDQLDWGMARLVRFLAEGKE